MYQSFLEILCPERPLGGPNTILDYINNEPKVRRSTKSLVLGKSKIMSYESLSCLTQ
jgi:hypothetical protein